MRLAGREAAANPSNQTAAANSLCALGRANGIDCAVVPQPGRHDWPFADQVFARALPWLAGQLGTRECLVFRCQARRLRRLRRFLPAGDFVVPLERLKQPAAQHRHSWC